jgi:NAD(P)-dependent dehydrogenase (short-subunit alcohol dehydrogenase family)
MSASKSSLWVVTGAGSGIGAALVRGLREAGHQVLALDINEATGEALANETGATFQRCDVSSPDDWDQVISTLEALGQPHRIALNAGIQIAPPDAPLSEYQFSAMTIERYRRMMGVNVDGVVFGLRALLPRLSSGAAIVVTASLAGITPYSVDPLYTLSKHAVVGLVRSMGEPLAEQGIKINAICPGGIDTAIIPEAQRTEDAVLMTPDCIADEIRRLMEVEETGKTWAKVSEEKPAFVIRAPGDRST